MGRHFFAWKEGFLAWKDVFRQKPDAPGRRSASNRRLGMRSTDLIGGFRGWARNNAAEVGETSAAFDGKQSIWRD